MKKFINNPNDVTDELLEGFACANADMITLSDKRLVVSNNLDTADRVTVVSIGGSGHEPAPIGFVGDGMLDISVAGDIFAAPGPELTIKALERADRGKGVLFVVLNHEGDLATGKRSLAECEKRGSESERSSHRKTSPALRDPEDRTGADWPAASLCIKSPAQRRPKEKLWMKSLQSDSVSRIRWQHWQSASTVRHIP